MPEDRPRAMGDDFFATPMESAPGRVSGPTKGEFIPPPDMPDEDERADALPEQEEFWRAPVRFGSIPVEKEPLGWDRRRGFRKLYPQVMLPTQVVERVSFGHPELEPNRLFWGDNLHVMRQLPPKCIDLIYIDPPFFSGRQYNVIFGDQNELRSFSDIFEAGMPGYLTWLNARLFEMKRILKDTGLIYVHLDWHAVHYVKVELDKLFRHDNFRNEIVWCYAGGGTPDNDFPRKHYTILRYSKTKEYYYAPEWREYSPGTQQRGRTAVKGKNSELRAEGTPQNDWWTDIPHAFSHNDPEKIGYPTQKKELFVERILRTSSQEGDIVADFFVGGGTTAAVAQRLGRRWIACDQSRVAVAITADRLARAAEQMPLQEDAYAVRDFTVEHWGIYEASRLAQTPPDQFRQFVIRAFGGVPDETETGIHGHKGAVPVWVGEPGQRSHVTPEEVQNFANSVRRTVRYQQDNLRDGIMLAWAFRPDAVQAAERLRERESTDLNFIRLDLLRIDEPRFREHVAALSTDKADYSTFLTFVQPPRVEVGWKRVSGLEYKFDVSETVVLNAGAKIINVQWDFDYGDRFSSTQGYSFVRTAKKQPVMVVDFRFPRGGKHRIACKVQDDAGGEGLWSGEIEVT